MRPSLTVCRSGLLVAAAAVLLTACGGSAEDEAAQSSAAQSSAAQSSAAQSSAAASESDFCTQAAGIEDRIDATLGGQTDPTALPQAMQEAAAEIRDIEPPDEIASDWNALADGVEQIAAAFGAIDFNDPGARVTLEREIGQLTSQLSGASTNVENYLRDECGIEPTAPTS
jgi:hypothetical protein